MSEHLSRRVIEALAADVITTGRTGQLCATALCLFAQVDALQARVEKLERERDELLAESEKWEEHHHDVVRRKRITADFRDSFKQSADAAEARVADLEREKITLQTGWDKALANWDEWMDRARAAESSCEALRKALEPFAAAAAELDDDAAAHPDLAPDSMSIEVAIYEPSQPTVGDLRRARTALAESEQ